MAANRIYIQVDFQSQSANAAIKSLNQNISNIGTSAAKTTAVAATGMKGFSVAVEQSSRAAQQLTSVLAGLAAVRLGATMFEAADKINRAEIAIGTIVKSAEVAKETLEDIREIAKKQPFRFSELTEMAQRLAGFGFEARKIPGYVRIISDTAAALGKGKEGIDSITLALGQMRAKGLAQGQELFRQLGEQGLDTAKYLAPLIAKEYNLSLEAAARKVRELSEKSQIAGKPAVAEIAGGLKEFAGAGEKMMGLVTVQVGKLQDELEQAGRTLAQDIAPAVLKVVGAVRDLVSWFSKLPPWIKVTTVAMVALIAAVRIFVALMELIKVQQAWTWLLRTLTQVRAAFQTIGIAAKLAFEQKSFTGFFQVLKPEMSTVLRGIRNIGAEFAVLGTIMNLVNLSVLKREIKEAEENMLKAIKKTKKEIREARMIEDNQLLIEDLQKQKHQMDIAREALVGAIAENMGGLAQIAEKSAGLLEEVKGNAEATAIAMQARAYRMMTFTREWHEKTIQMYREVRVAAEQAAAESTGRRASNVMQQLDQARDLTLNQTRIVEQERLEIQKDAIKQAAQVREKAAIAEFDKIKADLNSRLTQEAPLWKGKIDPESIKNLTNLLDQVSTRREAAELKLSQQQKQIALETQDEIARIVVESHQRTNDAVLRDQKERMDRSIHALQREMDVLTAQREQRPAQTTSEVRAYEEQRLQLATEYGERIQKVRRDQLDEETQYYRDFWKQLFDEGVISEVRFRRLMIQLDTEYFRRRGEMDADHTADQEKLRLDSARRTNDMLLQESRQIYDELRDYTGQIFDALMEKSTSVGKALLDSFKAMFIKSVKEMVTSRAAAGLSQLFGRGPVGFGGNVWDRLMGRQPTFELPQLKETMDASVKATQDLTVSLDRLTDTIDSGGTVERFGSADRSVEDVADIRRMVDEAAQRHGVPIGLGRAVAQMESQFNQNRISPRGAIGVMQLMPSTAKDLGVNPYITLQNIDGGITYLGQLMERYNGNLEKTLAAYNAGMGRVTQYGGVPPFPETQAYVRKGMAIMGKAPAIAAAPAGGIYDLPQVRTRIPGALPDYMPTFSTTVYGSADAPGGAAPTAAATPVQPSAVAGMTRAQPSSWSKMKDSLNIGKDINLRNGGTVSWAAASPRQRLGAILGSPGFASLAGMIGVPMALAGLQKTGVLAGAMTIGGAALTGVSAASALGFTSFGGALLGGSIGLAAYGLKRGGAVGAVMTTLGGAATGALLGLRFGGPAGALIGAGIGAAVGAGLGIARLFYKTADEKLRMLIKQVYGIDIPDRNIRMQILEIAKQRYGGNLEMGVRSPEVQEMVRMYSMATGQNASLPRPMYGATFAQSGTGGLQLQPVYSGGQQVASPYSGVTTQQWATGGLYLQLNPAQANQLFEGRVINVLGNNPEAVSDANTSAARAGDNRNAQRSAFLEPATVMR